MGLYELPAFAAYAVVTAVAVVGIWCSIYWIETVYAPERAGDANSSISSGANSSNGPNADGTVGTAMDGSDLFANGATASSSSSSSTTTTDRTVSSGTTTNGGDVADSRADGGGLADEGAPHEYSFTYDPRGCVAKYHRFSHAMLSGILGAQSVLLGKSTAELIKTAIAGRGNLFTHFGTYAILVCMFSCIFLQVHYLNEALKRVEATIVVPVFQTFWTLVSVIGGFVFYKEYRDLQALQVAMFGVGLVLILIRCAHDEPAQ